MSARIKTGFYQTANILLSIISAVCIAHVFATFFSGRSLWLDEAMLMKSVVTRDFSGILQGFFDENQSAPPCYMLAVKALSLIFGPSEVALRLYSLLMFLGSVVLVYSIARSTLSFRLPLLAVAVMTALPAIQQYACEAKPYMGDVFFSLLSIWVYTLYRRKSLRLIWLVLIMSVAVWFAFGALFTMGGICTFHIICEFRHLRRKEIDMRSFIASTLPLLVVAASVALYYFLWALPATTNVPDENRNNYWTFLNFPLIPRSSADLYLIKLMWLDFISTPGAGYILLFEIIAGMAIFIFARFRSWFCLSTLISAALVMIVSYLGMYPIAQRLLLSQYLIVWLMVLWSVDQAVRRIAKNKVTVIIPVLLVAPVAPVFTGSFQFNKESFYSSGHGFKAAYGYVLERKSPESKIYIPGIIRPVAQYYMNYSDTMGMISDTIVEKDGIIWGTIFRWLHCDKPYEYKYYPLDDKIRQNVGSIMKHDDVYILMTHEIHHRHSRDFFDEIKRSGMTVTTDTINATPIWHCTMPPRQPEN